MSLLPRQLNARIVLVVSCILLATGASFGWLSARGQVASLLDAMQRNASVLVRNFADTSARLLLVEDYAQLGDFLVQSLELPDVARLLVCEPDGRLVWDIRREPDGRLQATTGIDRVTPPPTASVTTTIQADQLVIWHPIEAGKPLGWIRAEYSLAGIRQAQDTVWRGALLMTAAWVACSALLILLLLNPIVRSIHALTGFSGRLDQHKGELTPIVGDILEIAELGRTLNEASVRLLTTERQLIDERERLREAEERYRTFADFTYDWEVWLAPDGNYRYVSPACKRITGHSAEEFMADPGLMLRLIHPDDRPHMESHLSTYAPATRQDRTLQFRLTTATGETRWIEHICHAVVREDGTYLGRRASNRDITERKRAEEEIRALNADLEARVSNRTAELEAANGELVRARNAAEAANMAKSTFLANMSHELRTPLNAILGFAQILERDQTIPDHARRNLQTINRSGRHLLDLINDVLEIARIEAGRVAVQDAPFDLPATIAAVEEMIRVRADAKGLALTVDRADNLPSFVIGDAHHLRQVLINLLGNAVKYTERGSVTLRVETNGSPDDPRIRFSVGDTGPGIDHDDQQRIFDAFYQTPAGAAKGEGTGLGLTISREFVRLMGGELTVSSSPGQGAVFAFSLPLAATAAPSSGQPGRAVAIAAGQTIPRVLIAEDDPDNREVIARLLEWIGFEVRVVPDGRQAVDAFLAWHPHFIWMDMRMPTMDGYEATRTIRSLPGGRETRIAALTASVFREDRGAILAAGCDEMVCKPIEERQVLEVMGSLLGIRYCYEEEARDSTPPAEADLSRLPDGLRADLAAAATRLDREAVLAVIEPLRASHPEEVGAITRLVDEYRFDKVAALCEVPRQAGRQAPPAAQSASSTMR